MFNSVYSEELKIILKKLLKKDNKRYLQVMKKIQEIISQDEISIMHYKNLRYDISDRKKVHIGKKFVLTFKYFIDKKTILFLKFGHRDDIYK
jgi:mRNA-degrading endonuclease RelE of RelBE toxin-antitoxin system